jgi:hypothetical protein
MLQLKQLRKPNSIPTGCAVKCCCNWQRAGEPASLLFRKEPKPLTFGAFEQPDPSGLGDQWNCRKQAHGLSALLASRRRWSLWWRRMMVGHPRAHRRTLRRHNPSLRRTRSTSTPVQGRPVGVATPQALSESAARRVTRAASVPIEPHQKEKTHEQRETHTIAYNIRERDGLRAAISTNTSRTASARSTAASRLASVRPCSRGFRKFRGAGTGA